MYEYAMCEACPRSEIVHAQYSGARSRSETNLYTIEKQFRSKNTKKTTLMPEGMERNAYNVYG